MVVKASKGRRRRRRTSHKTKSNLHFVRLRKADQNYLEAFDMCCSRIVEKIGWTDRVEMEKYYEDSRRKGTPYVQ